MSEITAAQMEEVEAIADAIVVTLQPFARAGGHALDAVSACVGVICTIADEYGERAGPHVKLSVLSAAIRELQAQAREWELM